MINHQLGVVLFVPNLFGVHLLVIHLLCEFIGKLACLIIQVSTQRGFFDSPKGKEGNNDTQSYV